MKKAKKKLTFASSAIAAGALLGLTGCPVPEEPSPDVYGPPSFNEDDVNEPDVCVYGPPEYFDEDIDNPEVTVYGPPSVDIDEPVEEVYGPPEDFEYDGSIESPAESSTSPEADNSDDGKEQGDSASNPDDDIIEPMVVVYGPPEP